MFRNADPRFPFLWETANQRAGRYNAADDGPAQYFADTADGAWAEFVRHAEITDPEELNDVRRSLWCVEIDEVTPPSGELPLEITTGGRNTYGACQGYARSLRDKGQNRIHERSAALLPGGARGFRVNAGLKPGPPRDGIVIVTFESLPTATGWCASTGSPPMHIATITRHF